MLVKVGGMSLIFLVATLGWFLIGLIVTGILEQLFAKPIVALFSIF